MKQGRRGVDGIRRQEVEKACRRSTVGLGKLDVGRCLRPIRRREGNPREGLFADEFFEC
jgi:hypothetical protein